MQCYLFITGWYDDQAGKVWGGPSCYTKTSKDGSPRERCYSGKHVSTLNYYTNIQEMHYSINSGTKIDVIYSCQVNLEEHVIGWATDCLLG